MAIETEFKVQIYAGRKGVLSRRQWFARIVSRNGSHEFRSSEGYNNRKYLETLCRRLFPTLVVEFMDPPSAVQ